MPCPDCGSPTGNLRFVTSVETHGLDCGPYEVFNEEFVVCCGCGGRYDIRDWEDARELSQAIRTPLRPLRRRRSGPIAFIRQTNRPASL